jgi:hypothetical protein
MTSFFYLTISISYPDNLHIISEDLLLSYLYNFILLLFVFLLTDHDLLLPLPNGSLIWLNNLYLFILLFDELHLLPYGLLFFIIFYPTMASPSCQ